MSHQTGIEACDELRSFFRTAKDGDIRMIKVGIENEQLILLHSEEPRGSWTDDYDPFVVPVLEPKEPCYILYRLDTKNNQGYEWAYISYVPDFAPVKRKMLFAATSATLKKEFGGGHIKEEFFGSATEDVKLSGYEKHLKSQAAPAPLTMAEEEMEEIKKNETRTEIAVDTKHQTMQGLTFPISQEALDRLRELKEGAHTYVQLSIDLQAETINLAHFEDANAKDLVRLTPGDQGRYQVFNFKHTHEGDYMERVVFIYSIPGYKCPVKERMLYSSCKAQVVEVLEENLGIEIAKKIEVDSPSELTPDFIYDEIHPKKNVAQQKFARPKGPAGRGPRRILKQ